MPRFVPFLLLETASKCKPSISRRTKKIVLANEKLNWNAPYITWPNIRVGRSRPDARLVRSWPKSMVLRSHCEFRPNVRTATCQPSDQTKFPRKASIGDMTWSGWISFTFLCTFGHIATLFESFNHVVKDWHFAKLAWRQWRGVRIVDTLLKQLDSLIGRLEKFIHWIGQLVSLVGW